MSDNSSRVRRVLERLKEIKRRREMRLNIIYSGACAALAIGVIGFIRQNTDSVTYVNIPVFSGSSLMFYGDEGYVLTALVAFIAGVVITYIFMHYRN